MPISWDEVIVVLDPDVVTESITDVAQVADEVARQPTFTQLLIDDFEDGDISEYSQDTSEFAVPETGFAYSGGRVLEATGGGSSFDFIESDTGLENYPERGDTFEYYIRTNNTGGTDAWCETATARQGTNTSYRVQTFFNTDFHGIYKWNEGTTEKDDRSVAFSNPAQADTWYRVTVDFDSDGDGTISTSITNLDTGNTEATASITDEEWDYGDWAWAAQTGDNTTVYFDAGRLTLKSPRYRPPAETPTIADTLVTNFTAGTTYIDSFDDENLDEYSHNGVGSFSFTSSTAVSGSALVAENSDNSSDPFQTSTSGLDNYPRRGDRFSVWKNMSDPTAGGGVRTEFRFATDGSTNYWVRLDIEFTGLFIGTSDDGAIGNASYSNWSADTWYEVEVEWDDGNTFGQNDGSMRATLYDTDGSQIVQTDWALDTALDGTGSSQGVAFGGKPNPDGNSPTEIRFDEATIKNR